jgi:hypothetical protein
MNVAGLSSSTFFLHPALELLLDGAEVMDIGNRVERHEADVVAVQRILRSGISEADPELHRSPSFHLLPARPAR